MKLSSRVFRVSDYNLETTLHSGQSFRWKTTSEGWEGVVEGRWVLLQREPTGIRCTALAPVEDWSWIMDYLQLEIDFDEVLSTYPSDPYMARAVNGCKGLRLLRQSPWECLASFILSSTKQIAQIRQVVSALCRCFGEKLPVPRTHEPAFSFPDPAVIADLPEGELRKCKMGFRAPFLKSAAAAVASGRLNLEGLRAMDLESARNELVKLNGVGPKIANCVLLFAYGFPTAFPLDVWILRALRALYFPKKHPSPKDLSRFSETHFGPYSGYAQQYLFHAVRTGIIALPKREPRKMKRVNKSGNRS